MGGDADLARRELAALGDALFQAERRVGHHSPSGLMARLERVAALHPYALHDALLAQAGELVASPAVGRACKIAVIRMGWAAIVQAAFRTHGLRPVARRRDGSRARAA
ncbi:hypothetical protein [Azospirillum thermophilum]|uniref:Uncharacterized protein n=1 Tax=Azospirillum thermophilum TaxID=2202148 RepID=A0A2S2CNJ6_9PROT|nr:hypothetical protein [Azospirillum thermophilum]AWK86019.1 hypothetical protein DEW08_06925 [Azospirillum thermophilum]